MACDLLTGAHRLLTAALNDNKTAGNPDVLGSDPTWPWWLFQNVIQTRYEGSSTAAAVVSIQGGWAAPNENNTMQFPRLSLEVYGDPTRNISTLDVRIRDAQTKIDAAFAVLDRVLHRPQGGEQWWGAQPGDDGVRVIGCLRAGELSNNPVVDGDGAMRGQCYYNLVVG